MCNHSFHPNCDLHKEDDGTIVLVALRDLQAGEQLQLSYGPLDNHTLLLDYGFMVHDNPYDNVVLNVDVEAIVVGPSTSGSLLPCSLSTWFLLLEDHLNSKEQAAI
jgi:hypothetical protein